MSPKKASNSSSTINLGLHNETFALALQLKAAGNEAYMSQNYQAAIEYYNQAAAKFTTNSSGTSTATAASSKDDQRGEYVKILSNKAQCQLYLKQYQEAGRTCTTALRLDPNHIKTLFRRAKATIHGPINDGSSLFQGRSPMAMAMAEEDVLRVLREEPNNQQAAALLSQIHAMYANEEKRYKKR